MSIIRNTLVATVAIGVSTGILLHDTHIDTVAAALNLPALHMNHEVKVSADHTHVERASLSQMLGLKNSTARTTPRNDERKYHFQKRTTPGRHAFDDYHLPVLG